MNTKLNKILAEISAGELIDKITILEIKKVKISNKDKIANIEKELKSLNETLVKSIPDISAVKQYVNDLKNLGIESPVEISSAALEAASSHAVAAPAPPEVKTCPSVP